MSSSSEARERARALHEALGAAARPDPLEDLSLAERALLQELERWRLDNALHAAWIAAGAPPITSDADHRRWFGMAYEKRDVKRRRK